VLLRPAAAPSPSPRQLQSGLAPTAQGSLVAAPSAAPPVAPRAQRADCAAADPASPAPPPCAPPPPRTEATNQYLAELKATAKYIAQRGRGILASDESNATTGKRLATVGVDNTEDNRRCAFVLRGGVHGSAGVVVVGKGRAARLPGAGRVWLGLSCLACFAGGTAGRRDAGLHQGLAGRIGGGAPCRCFVARGAWQASRQAGERRVGRDVCEPSMCGQGPPL
jgi:hypothetical protein